MSGNRNISTNFEQDKNGALSQHITTHDSRHGILDIYVDIYVYIVDNSTSQMVADAAQLVIMKNALHTQTITIV